MNWEPCEAEVLNKGKIVSKKFAAKLERVPPGVRVTLDSRGCQLAEWAANRRIKVAAKKRCKLKYGFSVDGHKVGAFAELAVVALTGLRSWTIDRFDDKPPDVGNTIQVRG